MILQGILHLLTGYDHLAFLFVALLGVVRQRDANDPQSLRKAMVSSLKVVTAFTVAHSITLTLAATGLVVFASKPVEASIAATVAAIAGATNTVERFALRCQIEQRHERNGNADLRKLDSQIERADAQRSRACADHLRQRSGDPKP